MDVHNNIERLKLAIKEELDNHLLESTEALSEIKTETIVSSLENHDTGPEANNPFSNVQLEIKQEVSNHMDVYNETVSDNQVYKDNIIKEILNNTDFHGNHDESKNDKDMVVKEENHEIPVSFDYPNYDSVSVNSIASLNSVNSNEGCSIDSYEALALGNVEACLQDELNIKFENDTYDDTEKMEYKTEPADTIMCNGVPSTADGLPKDVVVKLPEDKIKEEQILPTCEDNDNNFQLNSITGDLPSFADTNGMDSADSFQLNSITGNVMSLEQEAYSLLKEKKRKVVTSDEGYFACPDCPKIYTNKKGMYRHRAVHKCIERRAKGVARMLKTRKENQKKRAGEVKALNGIDDVSQKLDKNEPPALKKEGYECTCGEVFQRRSRMETCLRSHDFSEQVFRCVTCGSCSKSFKSKEELVSHRKRLHRKRFPCKFCPTDYETRKELFKHLRIHQKVQLMEYKVISEVVKGKQKLKCFMCTKTCSELSDLKSHVMNDHKEPYACPHCKNTFGKIIDFANHTKTYHPEVEGQSVLYVLEAFSKLVQAWKCQECGQQFLEADKLAMHQIENHSPEVKATSQFQCEDCRRVFISQKGLMSHRRIHHSVEAPEETKEVEPGVMCLECRKICADMTALTSHVRLHSPDRKYPCKFCDYRFATPEKRKAHADVHTGDMKYVCFICEYQCSSENRLKKHKMSLNHANMREYLLTGKPLIQEPQSTSSRKKESSSKKRKKEDSDDADDDEESSSSSESEVACDICGEKFPSEKDMLDHKQTHPFIEFPNEDTPTRIFFK